MNLSERHEVSPTPLVVLTIAGSDSGGGAGVAADLHTFAAHGVFGTLALTAVTAQNTEKVHEVVSFEAPFVESQIDAVSSDFSVASAKTGMLANVSIIDALTARALRGQLPPLVVDPVMVSSTGSSLLEGDGRGAYLHFIRHALIVTPNIPEAEVLLERSIRSLEDMKDAARELAKTGARFVLIKGGHLTGCESIDVVFDGKQFTELCADRIDTPNTHGTGCTLSAAIAANLALGHTPLEAIIRAKNYTTNAIRQSAEWRLGAGSGPIAHF